MFGAGTEGNAPLNKSFQVNGVLQNIQKEIPAVLSLVYNENNRLQQFMNSNHRQ